VLAKRYLTHAEPDYYAKLSWGSWLKARRLARRRTPPHLLAWGLRGVRPLRRTPERRLSPLGARRGPRRLARLLPK